MLYSLQRVSTGLAIADYHLPFLCSITEYFQMLNIMFQVFEKVILPTHNTHHVQFIMWYICSLRPKLAEVYVKYLWQQVTSVHVIPVTRQSAAAYVASFLARAKFIRIEYVSLTKILCHDVDKLM